MKALAIKKEIHHAIDVIEDKDFLKAVYVIINEKSKEYDFELSDFEKNELDDLKKQNKNGTLKSTSLIQIRKNAMSKLKK